MVYGKSFRLVFARKREIMDGLGTGYALFSRVFFKVKNHNEEREGT